jgi:hypothetical protein
LFDGANKTRCVTAFVHSTGKKSLYCPPRRPSFDDNVVFVTTTAALCALARRLNNLAAAENTR